MFKKQLSLLLIAGITTAWAVQIIVSPFSNLANIPAEQLQQIDQAIQRGITNSSKWELVSTEVTNKQEACDYDCTKQALANSQAQQAIYGQVENTEKEGESKITAFLIDKSGKEIQQESIVISANSTGNIANFIKLFEISVGDLEQSQVETESPDKVSQAANWVLGIGALSVLAVVLYSLL